ncbi:hypothetical protein DY78_GL002883 [Lactiplantibacillus fabifermentans DSM 21115]|nr:hypothetical protein DY78_GL002883 [Lactiplantibacillus fabifermentans DSM 21115]
MNGASINPTLTPDKFTDYDVAFFTTDVTPYRNDDHFLTEFGTVLLQTEPPTPLIADPTDGCTYLVQYTSGLRIDFQFYPLTQLPTYLQSERLTQIIGDKDQRLPRPKVPTDQDFWTTKPTPTQYDETVREFWWQFLNTLKANCRHQTLLAQTYLNLTRAELVQLWTWRVAFEQGFDRSYGKQNTTLLAYLTPTDTAQLMATFNTDSTRAINHALRTMQQLFVPLARLISDDLPIDYQQWQPLEHVPQRYLLSKAEPKLAHFFKSPF